MSNNYFNYNIKRSEDTVQIQVFPKEEDKVENEIVEGLTSIIVPAYLNSYPLFHMTGNCIGSIREHTDKSDSPYELILVLNGPPVIPFSDLSQTHCDKVIPLEENLGYAKAVNKAIRASKGEFVVVMNNDVLVYDNWLHNLKISLSNYEYDLVMTSPMYGMPWARAVEAKEISDKYAGELRENVFTEDKDFSCFIAKRSLFDEIGLLNEEFFVYGEDTDFLNRMKQAGKKYAMCKAINTTHIIGATSITMPDYNAMIEESKVKLDELWKK